MRGCCGRGWVGVVLLRCWKRILRTCSVCSHDNSDMSTSSPTPSLEEEGGREGGGGREKEEEKEREGEEEGGRRKRRGEGGGGGGGGKGTKRVEYNSHT